jgi:4-hydroxy-3-methylbut-2-enyl diphosphate reductase
VRGDVVTRKPSDLKIVLAQPRGFCAGVVRAIDIVERALAHYGAPIYVRHEIVHNRHVVEGLEAKGARFVEDLSEIPDGAVTIFSAHGVSQAVADEARRRGLPTLDATCPLVTKVHNQSRRYVAQGRILVLIGHAGHPEVEGTLGQIEGEAYLVQNEAEVEALPLAADAPIAYVTQTTLSVDDTRSIIAALQRRFADVVGPETRDICKPPCGNSPASPTSSWSSVRATVQTPTGCARSAKRLAFRAIWWRTAAKSIPLGCRTPRSSA